MYYWVAEDGSTYHGHNSQSPISGTDALSPNVNAPYAMRWDNMKARSANHAGYADSPCVDAGYGSILTGEYTSVSGTPNPESTPRDIGYHYVNYNH